MTAGRVDQPNLGGALRNHETRIGALEAQVGRWIYVLPIPPATPPLGWASGDTLAPSFQNSWGNVAGQQPVSFRVHPATRVAIRGSITGGSIPSVVFTLPVGFRPPAPAAVLFPSSGGTHIYTGRVDPNGDVWILGMPA